MTVVAKSHARERHGPGGLDEMEWGARPQRPSGDDKVGERQVAECQAELAGHTAMNSADTTPPALCSIVDAVEALAQSLSSARPITGSYLRGRRARSPDRVHAGVGN